MVHSYLVQRNSQLEDHKPGEKETPPNHAEVRCLVTPVAVQFSELCPNDATPIGTVLIGVNPFPAPTSQKLFPRDEL